MGFFICFWCNKTGIKLFLPPIPHPTHICIQHCHFAFECKGLNGQKSCRSPGRPGSPLSPGSPDGPLTPGRPGNPLFPLSPRGPVNPVKIFKNIKSYPTSSVNDQNNLQMSHNNAQVVHSAIISLYIFLIYKFIRLCSWIHASQTYLYYNILLLFA